MCRRRKNDINSLYYGYKYIVYMVIAVYIQSSPDYWHLQAVNIIWKSRLLQEIPYIGGVG